MYYAQNELFQNEARRVLGDDFLRDTYGDSAGAGGTAPPPGRGSSRVQPAGANQPHHEAGADLGIMRALNSMGSAAKRNLTQLAQGFNSNGRSQGSSGGNTTNSNRRRGSGGGSRRKGAVNDLEDVSCWLYNKLFFVVHCELINVFIKRSWFLYRRMMRRVPKSLHFPLAMVARSTYCKAVAVILVQRLRVLMEGMRTTTSTLLTLYLPVVARIKSSLCVPYTT